MNRVICAALAAGWLAAGAAAAENGRLVGRWTFDAARTARHLEGVKGAEQQVAALSDLAPSFEFRPDGSLEATLRPGGIVQRMAGRWRAVERREDGSQVIEWAYGEGPRLRSEIRFLDDGSLLASPVDDAEGIAMVLIREPLPGAP